MENSGVLNKIETIVIDNPVDKIIRQIKLLISSGQLKPGDRLPAERILAERFGVGRGYIREAILKLEFYGLLKTSPQSGNFIAGFSIKILDSIFADIITFNKEDFVSIIEARYYLEINAAKLAALRRTEGDIDQLKEALHEYDTKFANGQSAVEEDVLFHIKIASATKNSVIESMILILVTDFIKVIHLVDCTDSKIRNYAIEQHHKILDAIIIKDEAAAGEAMQLHLKEMMEMRFSIHPSK